MYYRLSLLIVLGWAALLPAAQLGARQYAAKLNRSGQFHHAARHSGSEVIYRSSGRATRWAALRAWRRSPAHRALLPRIRSIHCVGRICVGRGR